MLRKVLIVAASSILVIAAMLVQGRASNPVITEAPSVHLGEIAGFESKILEKTEAEAVVLPADTIVEKRLYVAPDGTWFQVSLVISGRSKSSIHRPELCIPSQGFQMTNPRDLSIGGVDWHVLTLVQGLNRLGLSYTFFNQEGYHTSSHLRRIFRDIIDRSFRSQIDRWAMVTVNSSAIDNMRISRFLAQLKGVIR